MKFEVEGNFEAALKYLIENSNTEVLQMWDILRGNDWFISTRCIKQENEFLQYESLKHKFGE